MEIFKSRGDFAKWADLFRKKGVKSLKIGDVTVEFTDRALLPESAYQKSKNSLIEEIKPQKPYTPEEILLWSSSPLLSDEALQ